MRWWIVRGEGIECTRSLSALAAAVYSREYIAMSAINVIEGMVPFGHPHLRVVSRLHLFLIILLNLKGNIAKIRLARVHARMDLVVLHLVSLVIGAAAMRARRPNAA